MIIKIIPETDAEKAKGKEVVLEGVKEYFLCGNRLDEEGTVVDFHQWHGSYKYLIGSLHFFHEEINDQRSIESDKKRSSGMANRQKPKLQERMVKYGGSVTEDPTLQAFVPSEAKEMLDIEPKNLDDDGEAFPEEDVPKRNDPSNILRFMPRANEMDRNGDIFTQKAIDQAVENYKKNSKKKNKEPSAGDFED